MKKTALILVAALLALASCAPKPRLVILHCNDTHSHFEPDRNGDYEGMGGVIERAAFVDSVRAKWGERVLVLHGGDIGQGTSYFTLLEGVVETDMMNAIGYDALSLGNHEFDNGIEALAERLAQMTTPVVCCNLDLSQLPLKDLVKPYVILERAGLKIGIIGITSNLLANVSRTISSRIPQLDDAECVNKVSAEIRDSCDLLILLSHAGIKQDCELVPKTHGLDLVIGAHSHTDMDAMQELVDADGKSVPMITDGCFGRNMGEIKLW